MTTLGVQEPNDVPALIELLGGNSAVGRLLDKGASTVSEMKRAKRIAPKYWPQIIKEAQDKGLPVTADTLIALHSEATVQ